MCDKCKRRLATARQINISRTYDLTTAVAQLSSYITRSSLLDDEIRKELNDFCRTTDLSEKSYQEIDEIVFDKILFNGTREVSDTLIVEHMIARSAYLNAYRNAILCSKFGHETLDRAKTANLASTTDMIRVLSMVQ